MIRWVWAVAIFAGSFAYLAYLVSSWMSWANAATDTADFLMSAQYLMVAHPPGYPVYNILAHYWLLAFGGWLEPAHALGLLSAMFASLASALLYWLSKSLVPSLIYMASMVVVVTGTIIDVLSMMVLSGLLAYALHRSGHHTLKYVALTGIHIFGLFYGLVFVVWDTLKEKRPAWQAVTPFTLSLSPYVYIFLANTPSPWLIDKSAESLRTYLSYSSGMANGLPLWPPDFAFTRLTDFTLLMLASLGAALVPLAYGLRDNLRRGDWLLPILIALPMLYYTTALTTDTYSYLAFAAPFISLVAYEGIRAVEWRRAAVVVVVVGAVLLITINAGTMSIGRALDPGLSAQAFYEALDTLPDGSAIDVAYKGWELQTAMLYTVAHPERMIDNLWEPGRLKTRKERTTRALQEGRLYRTRTVDRLTLATVIEKVQP